MFNDYVNLRPWKKAAELLAQEVWQPLYDLEQLARNQVKVSAVTWVSSSIEKKIVYEVLNYLFSDTLMTCSFLSFFLKNKKLCWTGLVFPPLRYVEFGFAQVTASKIKSTEQYITNQLYHDGIRDDAKDVMKRLFQISKREYCWFYRQFFVF